MGIDDCLGDAQSEPRSSCLAVPRGLAAAERARNAAQFVRSKSWAAIKNSDPRRLFVARHFDPHIASIFERIVEKISHRSSDEVRLDHGNARSRSNDPDLLAKLAKLARNWSHQLTKIDAFQLLARSTGPGKRQYVVKRRAHLLDGRDHALALVRWFNVFHADSKRCERRSEVVTYCAKGTILFLDEAREALVHVVERDQCIPKIDWAGHSHFDRLVSTPERFSGTSQFMQGARNSPGNEDRC